MGQVLLKYIIAAAIILTACLWFLPAVPLVDENVSAEHMSVLHIELGLESAAGYSTETYMDHISYTFSAGDQEFQQIMDILQQNTCRRTFRGLLGLASLGGSSTSEHQIHIAIYDEDGLITNIICDGEGGVVRDRTYRMKQKIQQVMMEELRAIYQS